MKKSTTRKMAALLVCVVAAICSACNRKSANDEQIAGSVPDVVVLERLKPSPWLRQRPANLIAEHWREIPADQIRELSPEMIAIALSMLDKSPFVELDANQLESLGIKSKVPDASKMHFLVRAVVDYCADPEHKLYVARLRDAVLVQSITFSAAGSTDKCAVVLDVDFGPTDIYVEASSLR
jgi:hypothetical protein